MTDDTLRSLLEAVSDAVVVVDQDRTLFLANSGAAGLFGLPPEPLFGHTIDAVLPHPGLVALVDETLEKSSLEPVQTELAITEQQTEALRTFQVTLVPLVEASGKGKRVIAVLRSRVGHGDSERGAPHFLSIVSHELKTPLHSIKGMAQILLEGKTGPLNDLQRDFLSTVKEQTDRLQLLVQELLDFGRLESGRLTLHRELVDVGVLAAGTVRRLGPLAQAARVDLVSPIPLHRHSVEADPMQIEQVLTNLCENAIRFTDAGGQVTVGARDRDAEVEIYVADTGAGIRSEELSLIFTPFYQGDRSRSGPAANVGLGLPIAKQIVEAHGGRIWVESAPNLGSTFHFTLPKTSRRETG